MLSAGDPNTGSAGRVFATAATGLGARGAWDRQAKTRVSCAAGGSVEVLLSNGGRVQLPYELLVELGNNNDGGGGAGDVRAEDVRAEPVDCRGMRYPGDPELISRVGVGVVPVAGAAAGPGTYAGNTATVLFAAAAVQPFLLTAASSYASPYLPLLPPLPIELSFGISLLLNAVLALFFHAAKFVGPKPPAARDFDLFLLSYEESDASTHTDGLEKPVPARFVNGTKTDPPGTAEKRWATTMAWRKREGIDTICLTKHPHYDEIKKCYPHFYCRTSLDGSQIAYYERPGFLDLPRLAEIGVSTMVRHYTFQVEFCWM